MEHEIENVAAALSWLTNAAKELGPYLIGYAIAIVLGHILVKPTVDAMWVAVYGKETLKRLKSKNRWLTGVLGCVERTLYVACISAGHAGFIAVWLGLKLVGNWRFLGQSNPKDTADPSVPGTVDLNLLLVGSALSLAYGALGAQLIEWTSQHEWLLSSAATLALAAGTLGLYFYIRKRPRCAD